MTPSTPRLSAAAAAAAVVALLAAGPSEARAQVGALGTDTAAIVADPGDVLGSARSAQARFERLREGHLPFTFASAGGECDEVVGRFCTWYGEGEWRPTPDPEELVALRDDLLSELDSLQRLSPGDGWIIGQRVWYRAEGGDWDGALEAARGCSAEVWWCTALEGFALHGLERYEEAEEAFDRALDEMAPDQADEWRLLQDVVDGDVHDALEGLARQHSDSLDARLRWLWRLADPLYLVAGNDRLTAHYARWTVATLKDGARNPFRMSWGKDLTELTVRHGWELGWERSPSRALGGPFSITGHKHPEAREWMPSEEALDASASTATHDFLADRRRPRTLHAPRYAPVILPLEGQLAVFRRVDGVVLVATAFLPEDTSYHSDHDHERPWMEPGDQLGIPDRTGLFALPVGGVRSASDVLTGAAEGALSLLLPGGDYVVSVESWSPQRRRAGRMRRGLRLETVPPDVAALSDLLLLEGGLPAPARLEDAFGAALSRSRIHPGDLLAVAWEVAGLGFRPETLRFALSVERTDRGVFRRIGELFGLADRPASLALSWEEPGPATPTPHFRHLDLALPDLEVGRYQITLTLTTAGRSDVVSRKSFEVVEP